MRKIVECIIIVVFTICCQSNCSEISEEVFEAAKQFAEKIFYEILDDSKNDTNIFVSPWSIYSALCVTLAATGGHTHEELMKGLFLTSAANDNKPEELHHQLGLWQRQAVSAKDGVTISLANRLFADKNFTLKKDFIELMTKEYAASVGQVPFKTDPAAARKMVNDWVEKHTQGKIKEALSKNDVDTLTKMILLNAVYFKGQWRTKFNATLTKEAEFQCSNSQTKKTVQMMEVKSGFSYESSDSLQAELLWLPFHDERTEMLIILPDASNDIYTLEKMLRSDNHSLFDVLRDSKGRKRDVNVRIPRLKLENQFSLKNILAKSFGMEDVFGGQVADFSPMTDSKEPLAISDAIHKTMFEVNEEGAVAAASTSISIKWRMRTPPVIDFTVDRPFMVVIVHDRTTPLFIGRIVCP